MRKKVFVIFDIIPEAIKMASLIKELQSNTPDFEVMTCVTAQHREMLDQAVFFFGTESVN